MDVAVSARAACRTDGENCDDHGGDDETAERRRGAGRPGRGCSGPAPEASVVSLGIMFSIC